VFSACFYNRIILIAFSTLSSGLNSLCAQFTEDFVKPNFESISDIQATVIAKLSGDTYLSNQIIFEGDIFSGKVLLL